LDTLRGLGDGSKKQQGTFGLDAAKSDATRSSVNIIPLVDPTHTLTTANGLHSGRLSALPFMTRKVLARRSSLKALTYRLLIMALDFGALYLLTGKVHIAFGFMIASNVYTTVAYITHERIWSRVGWGIE
jgi:uncharacterized membrane protein